MQGSHFKNNRFTFRMLSAGLGAAVVMVTGNVNMSRTCSPYKESSTCRPLSLSLSLCVSSVPAKPQAASSWHHMVAEWLLQHFIRARARLPKQRARSPLCWYLERKKKGSIQCVEPATREKGKRVPSASRLCKGVICSSTQSPPKLCFAFKVRPKAFS